METLATLTAAIKHSLGNRNLPANISATSIANDAIVYLSNQHSWSWMNHDLSVDFVAAQDWAALPSDLIQIRSLRRKAPGLRQVIPSTLDTIALLRQQVGYTGGDYFWALAWEPDEPAVPYLELYPTPADNETGAFQGFYLRKIPDLASSSDIPAIPIYLHPILKHLCRAFAISNEQDRMGIDWEIAQAGIQDAIKKDGSGQPDVGTLYRQIRTTSGESYDMERFYPYQGILP